MIPLTPTSTLFPYTTLFRSHHTRTRRCHPSRSQRENTATQCARGGMLHRGPRMTSSGRRSEEHTSELQSLAYLVCRLLLEKKKIYNNGQLLTTINRKTADRE